MELSANYIKRIEIDGLWDRFNIVWDLRPDVNILSGINGVGKTTLHFTRQLLEIPDRSIQDSGFSNSIDSG